MPSTKTSSSNEKHKGVFWISGLTLDRDVHRTSRIEILRHLAKRGYDTYLIALRTRDFRSVDRDLHIRCVPLRDIPFSQPLFYTVILAIFLPIYWLIKKPKFIIVEPGLFTLSLVWKPFLSFGLKSKAILDIRSIPVEVRATRKTLKAIFFNVSVLFAKRFLDGITIITKPMRDQVSRNFQLDRDRMGVWTSGVSASTFEQTRYVEEARQLRKSLGLNGKYVIFYHGVITERRGIIESVQAMRMLKDGRDDVVLFLLGNGPALPTIRSIIDRNELRNVIIQSPVKYSEVPKYIAMSDVGIVPLPNIPDWTNQSPLNLLEYLAMEKPVIVTDIPANRAIVGASKCGIYISSADPKVIAQAIDYAYTKKQMMKQLGALGRSLIIERYDWARVAKVLEDYLNTL